MRVIVVGSGIGGLATAIALRRVGIDVTVYERAPLLGDVGAGISLWANAFRALEHLGAADAVRAVSQPMTQIEMRAGNGLRPLATFSAERLAPRVASHPVVGVAHRADLVAALAGLLPAGVVRYAFECVAAETEGEMALARFANGHSDRADVIVGADGIKSVVRTGILGAIDPIRYSGYTCWRGVCPRPDRLPRGAFAEWWGRGRRFGITTIPGDRVYWFAPMNAPPGGGSDEAKLVAEAFAEWADPVPALIAGTPTTAVLRNDIVDRPPNPKWVSGRLVLLGDAAHPTTPNLGQGGCLAIEDAVVLARCLRTDGSMSERLARFVAARFPRTRAITKESWKIGRIGQWQGRVSCGLRDSVARWMLPLIGESSMTKFSSFDVGPLSGA